MLAAFGFVRLVFVARTQRLGIKVCDSQLIELVQQLASQLSCQTESPAAETENRFFRREPVSFSEIVPNESGMIVVRVRELLEHVSLQAFEPMVAAGVSTWFASEFPQVDPVVFDLRAIEWVAGKAIVKFDYDADAPEGSKHTIQFGASELTVKLNREVHVAEWIKQYVPDAVRHVIDDHKVFQLAAIPTMGPLAIWLTERGDGIISITFNGPADGVSETTTVDSIFGDRDSWSKTPTPSWGRTWGKVGGGLVSVVFTDSQITNVVDVADRETELGDVFSQLAADFTQQCSSYAYGIDTDDSGSGVVLQTRLTHVAQSDARQSADQARELIKLTQDDDVIETLSPTEQQLIRMTAAALQKTSLVIEEHADGSADLVATTPISISELVGFFVTSAHAD